MATAPETAPSSPATSNSTSNGTTTTPPASSPPPSPPAASPPPASPPPSPPASPPPSSPPPSSPPPSNSSPPSSPSPPPPQSSPPPNSPPPSSPPPSPPAESQSSPPPKPSSPPPSSPPQSSSPPGNSQTPPSSPPPPASNSPPTSTSPPPPTGTPTPPSATNGSTSLPIFSPPPPGAASSMVGSLSPPPPPASSHKSPSPQDSGGSHPSPSSSSTTGIIVGSAVGGGLVVLLLAVICVMFFKRKKRQPYYIDPGYPPKAGDPYYNPTTNWNSPGDHIVKISPPPGVLGTPGVMGTPGGPGIWGAPPPPPPAANTSSEYSSNSGQHQQPLGQFSPGTGVVGGGMGGFSKFQFTYEELAVATGGFCQANLLGQGGFGFVHKGVLPDGQEVAIKSLKSGSGQGEREFQAEVEIISRVHHRHLVSLVGYCINENQRMLVYEFVPNKTLEFHLHGKGRPVMDWGTRLKIALGSAKGLAYLHEDCHPRIIHRDIKAANILLDENNEAMVADFGLAKLTSDNLTHVSTRVMGTFGYLAPEYASSGKLTEKSDVFSFGVMLLELITGKRPVDPTNKFMEDSLVDWARPRLTKALEDGNYDELVDPRLEGNYSSQEMAHMISCAAACIRHSARRRPKMSQIVRALDGDSSVDLNDGPKRSTATGGADTTPETETYNTSMYNADMEKFQKMVMSSHDFNSSEYGATTSEYGLDPSTSSSDEFRVSQQLGKKI